MKTIRFIRAGLLVVAVATIALNGCKKEHNDPPDTSKLQQTALDNRLMSDAVDDAAKDADKVMSGGSKGLLWIPCNATLDSMFTIADTVTYIITYDGLNCQGNYNREGVVEVHKNINTPWHDAGTSVYVKFVNLKVTKVSTGKYAFINGIKIHKNVSGGFLSELGNGLTSITRRVNGSLTATFDDNSTRTWNVARFKTFTGMQGDLSCSVEGFGSADGYNNLEAWGTTRHGDLFYNQITTAVVFKEACDNHPVTGSGIIRIPADGNASATLTFGYDDNHQPVTNGTCPTHFKVEWEKTGNSGNLYSGTLYIQL